MDNTDFTDTDVKLQRPTFLTVICILTFIGSGWGALSNIYQLLMSDLSDAVMQMEQYSSGMQGKMEGGGVAGLQNMMESTMQILEATMLHAKEIYGSNLLLSMVSLVGAVMMFQLRRKGFYVYTTAQILMLFVMPYYAGFSVFVIVGLLWSVLITAAFVVMYAVHLKYMR